ncbi:MAG: hypothetical protein H6732_14695 [Alphaproteobacteria bacterium]|nr:hypothetical protein [Alphaproteobacteria bacterium]
MTEGPLPAAPLEAPGGRALPGPPRPPAHPLAVMLALVLPLVVLGMAWKGLQRTGEATGKAIVMERQLRAAGQVEVVVLGSSLARTDVDAATLADALGIPTRAVVMLTLPNATAAHWYAILDNRVFANGHRPRVVLFVGALTTMLTPEVLKEANIGRLVAQLDGRDEVIARKVFGTDSAWHFQWLFARERAGEVRDRLVQGFRDGALSMLFRGTLKPAVGARLADRANAVVFADEQMDYTLHAAAPTGLFAGAVDALAFADLDLEQDSLLPDLVALARAHDARPVFVRTPFPPSHDDNDRVPPALEDRAEALLAELGATYLDLRALGLQDRHYRDMRHMSREAAILFTRAIAQGLQDGPEATAPARIERTGTPHPGAPVLKVANTVDDGAEIIDWDLRGGPLDVLTPEALASVGRAGVPPVRVEVGGAPVPWLAGREARVEGRVSRPIPGAWWTRHTTPRVVRVAGAVEPELVVDPRVPVPADGPGPAGWWVPPGTTLSMTLDAARGPTLVRGHVLGGAAEAVEVRLRGEPLALAQRGARVWAEGPAGTGPWSLSVHSPAGGPWVSLDAVSVGEPPLLRSVIGSPDDLAGASVRLIGGQLEDTALDARFASPPVAVEAGAPRRGPRRTLILPVRPYVGLADGATPHLGVPHKCSPLRVLEDGVPLALPQSVCEDVANLGSGRTCHAAHELYVSSSDGTDPFTNGRTYSLALEPSRLCDRLNQPDTTPLRGSLWIYPHDHARIAAPPERMEDFLDGANRLELVVDPYLAPPGAELVVRVRVGDRVALERVLKAGSGGRQVLVETLDPPLPPRARDVVLELTQEDDEAFWLVVMATLTEDHPFGRSAPSADVGPSESPRQ